MAGQSVNSEWLQYYEKGIRPSRNKYKYIVYSDNHVDKELTFELNDCRVILTPIDDRRIVNPSEIDQLMPSFICEVVTKQPDEIKRVDLYAPLYRIFPLANFKYRHGFDYEHWGEYNGKWLKVPGGRGSVSAQYKRKGYSEHLLQKLVQAYELLDMREDKRAKKARKLRARLYEAIELELVSRRYSFLSFYNVLEIVSDDLAANNHIPTGNAVAQEMARYSLSSRGSQRTKIYFLLTALENDFSLESCMKLSDIRNDVAHGEQSVEFESHQLCKELAYWAMEHFVLQLVKEKA